MKLTATAHSVLAEAREEIAKRDRVILEQQARIELLQSSEREFILSIPEDFSALEAHDREVRAKAFEDAAYKLESFGGEWSSLIILGMAENVRNKQP